MAYTGPLANGGTGLALVYMSSRRSRMFDNNHLGGMLARATSRGTAL
jgi:hypothetical protein